LRLIAQGLCELLRQGTRKSRIPAEFNWRLGGKAVLAIIVVASFVAIGASLLVAGILRWATLDDGSHGEENLSVTSLLLVDACRCTWWRYVLGWLAERSLRLTSRSD
jgi:hypothetical protein